MKKIEYSLVESMIKELQSQSKQKSHDLEFLQEKARVLQYEADVVSEEKLVIDSKLEVLESLLSTTSEK